eukprot:TRINITY_DN6387_c0_g1_i1.p1 TRINITY_DN6387_c0_g1~~TRINITY_DN6387_c0_g1_i1.p1  ORF type:complete len:891 (+),score=123.97 TRINITY_DN6387_c0_g1_i1:29-2674(+)
MANLGSNIGDYQSDPSLYSLEVVFGRLRTCHRLKIEAFDVSFKFGNYDSVAISWSRINDDNPDANVYTFNKGHCCLFQSSRHEIRKEFRRWPLYVFVAIADENNTYGTVASAALQMEKIWSRRASDECASATRTYSLITPAGYKFGVISCTVRIKDLGSAMLAHWASKPTPWIKRSSNRIDAESRPNSSLQQSCEHQCRRKELDQNGSPEPCVANDEDVHGPVSIEESSEDELVESDDTSSLTASAAAEFEQREDSIHNDKDAVEGDALSARLTEDEADIQSSADADFAPPMSPIAMPTKAMVETLQDDQGHEGNTNPDNSNHLPLLKQLAQELVQLYPDLQAPESITRSTATILDHQVIATTNDAADASADAEIGPEPTKVVAAKAPTASAASAPPIACTYDHQLDSQVHKDRLESSIQAHVDEPGRAAAENKPVKEAEKSSKPDQIPAQRNEECYDSTDGSLMTTSNMMQQVVNNLQQLKAKRAERAKAQAQAEQRRKQPSSAPQHVSSTQPGWAVGSMQLPKHDQATVLYGAAPVLGAKPTKPIQSLQQPRHPVRLSVSQVLRESQSTTNARRNRDTFGRPHDGLKAERRQDAARSKFDFEQSLKQRQPGKITRFRPFNVHNRYQRNDSRSPPASKASVEDRDPDATKVSYDNEANSSLGVDASIDTQNLVLHEDLLVIDDRKSSTSSNLVDMGEATNGITIPSSALQGDTPSPQHRHDASTNTQPVANPAPLDRNPLLQWKRDGDGDANSDTYSEDEFDDDTRTHTTGSNAQSSASRYSSSDESDDQKPDVSDCDSDARTSTESDASNASDQDGTSTVNLTNAMDLSRAHQWGTLASSMTAETFSTRSSASSRATSAEKAPLTILERIALARQQLTT